MTCLTGRKSAMSSESASLQRRTTPMKPPMARMVPSWLKAMEVMGVGVGRLRPPTKVCDSRSQVCTTPPAAAATKRGLVGWVTKAVMLFARPCTASPSGTLITLRGVIMLSNHNEGMPDVEHSQIMCPWLCSCRLLTNGHTIGALCVLGWLCTSLSILHAIAAVGW